MLVEMRETVCEMWKVADNLDNQGLGKVIPFIPEGSDLRHTIKGELIYMLLRFYGFENLPNPDQVQFLRYVIHAPIKLGKEQEYVDVFKDSFDMTFNHLVPFFAMIDKECNTKLTELYIKFIGAMTHAYLKMGDCVDSDMLVRYHLVMAKNKALYEKWLDKPLEYDHFDWFEDGNKKIIVKALCEVAEEKEEKDEIFENYMNATNIFNVEMKESEVEKETDLDESNVIQFEERNDKENEALDKLDSLIGLSEVKAQVRSMISVVKVREECKKRGINRQPMSYHMVFQGNPGTGKTTVARLIAEAYHDMGLLSKGHLVEVGRADLVAGYVGQTALKVKKVIDEAKGGVLFIDEAYALAGSENDFGSEAISTLLKGMEDSRDDLIVIVAGYPDLMQSFLDSNPGLKSRFSKNIDFPDYSADELTLIFKKYCRDNSIYVNSHVLSEVRSYFEKETARKKGNYGNARSVRNYFEAILVNQADRLVKSGDMSHGSICNITLEDLPKRVKINNMNPERR